MSILIFLAVLFVLILVHEWGHFIVAKKVGMRVDEFAIGFPPRLFSVRVGETEYSLNLFPIGGFVKIFGENPQEVSVAGNPEGSFGSKSKWAQTAVLLAGVCMNIILAFCIFTTVLFTGTDTVVSEEEVENGASLMVTEVLMEGPGGEAGIAPGMRIIHVSSNGDDLETLIPSAFQAFVTMHHNDEISITYERGGDETTVVVMPEAGLLAEEPERAAVGVVLSLVKHESLPLHEAVIEAGTLTVVSLRDITVGIGGLLWDAVQFKANLKDVAGPIGIVGLVEDASAFGFTTLLMFTAFISLNLAVINLLPFPALDGGRILFVIIEALKGSPIKPAWAGTLNMLGFVFLILLMIAVTYSDILKLL